MVEKRAAMPNSADGRRDGLATHTTSRPQRIVSNVALSETDTVLTALESNWLDNWPAEPSRLTVSFNRYRAGATKPSTIGVQPSRAARRDRAGESVWGRKGRERCVSA